MSLDVAVALVGAAANGTRRTVPRVIGGRTGLSSKAFAPAMAKAAFDELKRPKPRRGFTLGITDDVTNTSLGTDSDFNDEEAPVTRPDDLSAGPVSGPDNR